MRFLPFLTFFLANLASAQDWFEIEVIIFEHKDGADLSENAENWPRDLDLNWPTPILELEPAVERPEPREILPPYEELVFAQRRMNNDSYALRTRQSYDLLWHKAWRAPLLPQEKAPWILVQASDQLADHYRLEGAVRIHLSRYLHLHTNLWLTEVSGPAIIETALANEVAEGPDQEEQLQVPEPLIEETAEGTEFDWSQLPEPPIVRWGCNYVRELWPEEDRLIPADYYENPAPADWYHPFGCKVLSELIEQDIPYFVNIPPSDRYSQTELKLYYPELFVESGPETELQDALELFGEEPHMDGNNLGDADLIASKEPGKEGLTEAEQPVFPVDAQLLNDLFTHADGSFAGATPGLIPPEPKVHYPVKEIIHITGKRRMRSGEFHYIDHPKIGILAIIHPVEQPELVLEPELPLTDIPAEQTEAVQ